MKKIARILAAAAFLLAVCPQAEAENENKIIVNTAALGKTLPNIVDNVNVWDMGTLFHNPKANEQGNVFRFVKYVQLMQCTGGTAERDLFRNPTDTTTFTDYDFSRLVENCRGILSLGAKPHLKLGGVPIKMTKGYRKGGFGMNDCPPDDYTVYYDYIRAIAETLVREFGKKEVRTWRFGCMTEYENKDWFHANIPTDDQELLARESAVAYCKLYDYTAKALTDVLGKNVFVGAHSMTVTEGLWDEEIFIKHVAQGKNYATGRKGTPIKFLAASFYDVRPGEFTKGMTLPQTIDHLRSKAEKYGLKDLIYGIDEGRLLYGNSRGRVGIDLLQRVTGFTWQAAYDARLFKQGMDHGLSYLSSWQFLTKDLLHGYPTIGFHVADNIADFAGMKRAETTIERNLEDKEVDFDCLAAYDRKSKTLRLMVYHFKNSLDYTAELDAGFTIKLPGFKGDNVLITKKVVDDDCNFFDEWQADRKKHHITDDKFAWSPDDPALDDRNTLHDPDAIKFYRENLRDKYIQCAVLRPTTAQKNLIGGELTFRESIKGGTVVFYEITEAE